jgi:hypothetical protein
MQRGRSAPRCSCCGHHGQRPTTNTDRHAPADSPEDAPCQGICGGAVLDGLRAAAVPDDAGSLAVVAILPASHGEVGCQLYVGPRIVEHEDRAVHPRRVSCLYAVWRC